MPADVSSVFAHATAALARCLASPPPPARKNVFEVWNVMAAKFPDLYPFASATKAARETEGKLCAILGKDRVELARLFSLRLETEESDGIEGALNGWWKEVAG